MLSRREGFQPPTPRFQAGLRSLKTRRNPLFSDLEGPPWSAHPPRSTHVEAFEATARDRGFPAVQRQATFDHHQAGTEALDLLASLAEQVGGDLLRPGRGRELRPALGPPPPGAGLGSGDLERLFTGVLNRVPHAAGNPGLPAPDNR